MIQSRSLFSVKHALKRVQKRHEVWIFKGWLVGRLSGPSGATSGRWREMVAEKVSDVGVGAQGLTSADAEPSAKGNPTPSTSRGEGGRETRIEI
jgi:hypothetical protein